VDKANMVTHRSSVEGVGTVNQAIMDFRRDGVAVARGLFSGAEVAALQQEATRLWDSQEGLESANLRVGLRKNVCGDVILERLDPVADISGLFDDLSQSQKLVRIAEMALGEPVTVLKDKIIYKWPGTAGYGLHRDEPYFGTSGVPGAELVSVSVALDPVRDNSGGIEFFPGQRRSQLPAPAQEGRDILRGALEGIAPVVPELDPGDLLFFDGLIPHCSDYNSGARSRRMYTATYAPARYHDCRKRYYAIRWEEQKRERSACSEDFYFK
jgi:ectoine hydroxylase-related dioxygenase (phytanoyl-CoA dioxygenase family)